MWPIGLRDRLPIIPISLRAPDPDVPLDLQALLHLTYDKAGYVNYINEESPDPPLPAGDAEWAQLFLPEPRR